MEVSSPKTDINKLYVNIIFVLMDILAAYYAPNIPQLIISVNDHEHIKYEYIKYEYIKYEYIAYELQFFKTHWHSGRPSEKTHLNNNHPSDNHNKEYFIKKCR